jgi:hypothetical protein
MRILPILALSASLALSATCFADWPNTPEPWVKASDNGRSLFKMVPERITGEKPGGRKASGIAYGLSDGGELKELWRAEGWYGYRGHISDDGRYLVLLGPPAQEGTIATDLAIAFYDRGKLVKEYTVGALLKDEEALVRTTSKYIWEPERQTQPTGFYPGMGSHFHLVMADKTTYAFEVATGAIVSTETDAGARNSHEIRKEDDAREEAEGKAILERSAFRKDYESHFDISEVQALKGSISSCSLEGPAWTATLTPKKKLAHPTGVEAVFQIKGDHAVATLHPSKMIAAMEMALRHPSVAGQFAGGATGLRLRTQGDRLHWNTPELRAFIKQVRGNEPEDPVLEHWAYIIIDHPLDPRYRSFYLDTAAGNLIYEEGYKNPPVLILLDGAGKKAGKPPAPPAPPE